MIYYISKWLWFGHFARVLFSWNYASAAFPENKKLMKISEFTVTVYKFSHILDNGTKIQPAIFWSMAQKMSLFNFLPASIICW